MKITDNILWEYNKADRLNSLITLKEKWYVANDESFWTGFFNSTFDLSGNDDLPMFGLVVWAIILNVPLDILYPLVEEKPWGVGPFRENFYNANFASSSEAANLTKREKIQALRLAYYRCISNGSVTFLNAALRDVFIDDGVAYVLDNGDMTLEYVFKFPLSNNFVTALNKYNILPSVCSVKTIITVSL